MKIPSIVEMLQAGVHFGHQTSRWYPKMAKYIFTERHGVHILDLEKSQKMLEETLKAVEKLAAEGKQILFVSTKPQAREIVKEAAISCNMPYLTDRWLGGMLTNFAEIKKLIANYNKLKEQQASGELEKYTKKERLEISKKLDKMDTYLGGLSTLKSMPDAMFVPAVQREKTAMVEANKTGVPVIGVCDTNANPEKVLHVIPANDDAVKSISMIVNLVAEAAKKGAKSWEKKQSIAKKAAEAAAPKQVAKKVTPTPDQSV